MEEELGEDLVTCTICLEHFVHPKTLNCLHTFCEACLRGHLSAYLNQQHELVHPLNLPCPTCRELTLLRENGISGLRTDFKIAKITEVLSKVNAKSKQCDVCMTVKKESVAIEHCKECNKNFCSECIYRHRNTVLFDNHMVRKVGGKNINTCTVHEDESLKYFCQSCSISICTLCAMTEHMMHSLEDLNVGRARHERTLQLRGLLADIDHKVEQLDGFLKLMDTYEDKLKLSYKSTANTIKSRAAQIVSHIQDEEKELLKMLTLQFEGKLDNIVVERDNIKQFKHSLSNMKVQASASMPDNKEVGNISAELIRQIRTATAVPFINPEDFEDVEAGFGLTFCAETPKLGHLKEQCISSNLSFISRIPVRLVKRITDGELDWPSDVTLLTDGSMVVADTDNYQLKVFNKEGQLDRCIGVGEVKPAGVAATAVGTIVVTDILDRCVKIFNIDGGLLYEFGHNMFDSPAAIAVNRLGQYIVSDVGKGCITVHNSQGDIISTLSCCGAEKFDGPWYVATNDQNDILVSDMGHHSVKVYSKEQGEYSLVTTISDPEQILCPNGIDVDFQGNILVCDNGRNAISVYTPDGNFINSILLEDDGIDCPHGISVNDAGQVALTLCGTRTSVAGHELRLYQLYD